MASTRNEHGEAVQRKLQAGLLWALLMVSGGVLYGQPTDSKQPAVSTERIAELQKERAVYEVFVKRQTDDPTMKLKIGEVYLRLASVLVELGDRDGAKVACGEGKEVFGKLCIEQKSGQLYKSELARCHSTVANLLMEIGFWKQEES